TTLLPAACRTFVEVAANPAAGLVGYVHSGHAVDPVALEHLPDQPAAELARRLSPLVDAGARVDDDSDLPRSVSLLGIAGPELASSANAVIERWTANRSVLSGRYAPPKPGGKPRTLRALLAHS